MPFSPNKVALSSYQWPPCYTYRLLLTCPDFFFLFWGRGEARALTSQWVRMQFLISFLRHASFTFKDTVHPFFLRLHSFSNFNSCSQGCISSLLLFFTYVLCLGYSVHYYAINDAQISYLQPCSPSPPSFQASSLLSMYLIGIYRKPNIPKIENLTAYPPPNLLIPQPFPFQ